MKDTDCLAFPTSFSSDYPNEIVGGMTLRDYFAAKAMQPLIRGLSNFQSDDIAIIDNLAIDSFSIADAMLKARG